MRWRRGLLRSWVVLSVLWVLVVCTGTYLTWPVDDWVLPTGEHFIDPFDAAVKHRLLVNCALLAVGLPTGMLALGAALFWAARGFWPK